VIAGRILIAAVFVGAGVPTAAERLTEAPRLAAIYDSILGAEFERAAAQLAEACPPAPPEACTTLAAISLWWQININPETLQLDERFNDAAKRAIAATEAWTRREPDRGESWFYLAGSHAPVVQWRILRGERLAAAREGSRIKSALERALRFDPDLADAYFGIGLYHYYAGVAPAYARMLRWLLVLPGGNREEGLREMMTARNRGELLTGEADFQLSQLLLWYEHRVDEAALLLESLDRRYPGNPLFTERLAELEYGYRHDARASANRWRALLERARLGEVYSSSIGAVRARLGLAAMQIELGEIDDAIAQLQIVADADPIVPPGARQRALAMIQNARTRKNF
jgi:tetratricopeptide (TPR) repeat protein